MDTLLLPSMGSLSEGYVAMTSNMHSPNEVDVHELLDLICLPEDQRLAFYGSMLAIAAADGIFAQDELDLIFESINTDGLSEHGRNTLWDYLVATPLLTDCMARFSTSNEQVRCALMVYLIEVALADRILDVSEEEALLQARRSLHISQKQIEAIERYICEVGLIRARPSDYKQATTSLKHGVSLLTALSIPATAIYFSSAVGGVSLPEILSRLAHHSFGLAMVLGAGATILIGTAAFLTGRRLDTGNKRKRTTRARERRRRAQLAVRNLQDAVGYLATKTNQLAAVGGPGEPGKDRSDAFAERLRVLQQMLTQRQLTASVASSLRRTTLE
jgi:uncharacterized tellurite resistance protein B-like protein